MGVAAGLSVTSCASGRADISSNPVTGPCFQHYYKILKDLKHSPWNNTEQNRIFLTLGFYSDSGSPLWLTFLTPLHECRKYILSPYFDTFPVLKKCDFLANRLPCETLIEQEHFEKPSRFALFWLKSATHLIQQAHLVREGKGARQVLGLEKWLY